MALTQVAPGLLDTTAQYYSFKNRIINGAMMIDQRNAGASVTPTSAGYTLDRFIYQLSQASKAAIQQNAGSVTPPTGFSNYLGVTSSSAYSVGASESFYIVQRVEGFNFADMAWGTANAQTVTLSFWVRSSLTGTFGAAVWNSAANRAYPVAYTINAANTWEYKTITIPGDTTGTWIGATNGIGVNVAFGLGFGSSISGTSGAWNAGTAFMPTGATSVVGTNGATFYITGVQLEKGSTATSFDYRPYGTELALCQRYYEVITLLSQMALVCQCYTTSQARGGFRFTTVKRAAPTMASSGSFGLSRSDASNSSGVSLSNLTANTEFGYFDAGGATSLNAGNASTLYSNGSGIITASAEL
jgi:hypothetical protein